MKQGIQALVRQLNFKHLETQLALQCAPVFLGIKISNILLLDSVYQNFVKRFFHNTVLSYYQLYDDNERVAFLIFYHKPLLCYLKQPEVWELMKEFDYTKVDLGLILKKIEIKYKHYMLKKENFPHELGLLLGYPPEDVKGFVQHKGKNYLFSGYWKVYDDVDKAKRVFEQYEKAEKLMLTWVLRSGSVGSVLTFRHVINRKYKNYRKIINDKRRNIT